MNPEQTKGSIMAQVKACIAIAEIRGELVKLHGGGKWAQNALIPQDKWTKSNLQHRVSVHEVLNLAQELRIHPAIVAGRVRKEHNNYRLLTHFVGNGEVSRHFPTAPFIA
jgi:hypothetical protein